MRADCAEIAKMLAAGEGEAAIRDTLKLGRRAYQHRMRCLRQTSLDARLLWATFLSGTNEDLRKLAEIGEAALAADPPRNRLFIQTATASLRLRRAIIETGQLLGVYDRVTPTSGALREQPLRFRELFALPEEGGFREPQAMPNNG